jgi:hypothetical protein
MKTLNHIYMHLALINKTCPHMKERMRRMRPIDDQLLPLEMFLSIRAKLDKNRDLANFDEAFRIDVCERLFCLTSAAEIWFEDNWPSLSIIGTLKNWRKTELAWKPTFYKVNLSTTDNLNMYVYKQTHDVIDPSLFPTDEELFENFTLYSIYASARYVTNRPTMNHMYVKDTPKLKRKYTKIVNWFKRQSWNQRRKYIGYACKPPHTQGSVWIPYDLLTCPNGGPSQAWVTTIYETYKLEQQHLFV